MKIVPFPPDIQSALSAFAELGGCVQYAWVDGGTPPPYSTDVHRRAAILAVETLCQKYSKPPSLWRPMFDQSKIATLTSSIIVPADFLGSRWHAQKEQLIMRKPVPNRTAYDWVCANDEPTESNVVSIELRDFIEANRGYSYAFSDPPYKLRNPQQAQILFDAVGSSLLPRLWESETRILQWPTDWSNFFDAGNDWWGSFLWTIEQIGMPLLTITASTTD